MDLQGVVLWVPRPRTFMIGYIGTRLWFVAQVQPGHNSETARQCTASLNQIIFSKSQQFLTRSHTEEVDKSLKVVVATAWVWALVRVTWEGNP